jgi:hypothetical protein
MEDASGGYMVDADLKAMQDLADKRSIRGTSASRMAADARSAAATLRWAGKGVDYVPTNPDADITDRAPERAYLVVMNGGAYMSVIHHLFRWKAPDGGRSRLDGRIVTWSPPPLAVTGTTSSTTVRPLP